MIRLYVIGALVAALLGLGWLLKVEIGSNATLRANNKQLDEARVEAEDVAFFQQSLGELKDTKNAELLAALKRNAALYRTWKGRYDEMLNSKPENRAWGDSPLPPDVVGSLRRNRRDPPNPAGAHNAARDLVSRLRAATRDEVVPQPGPAAGNQGVGDRP